MKIDIITRKTKTDNNDVSIYNLQGPLYLHDNPQQALEAATKQYVDLAKNSISATNITSGILSVERLPVFTGDLVNVEGSNLLVLTPTGVTAGTYTRVSVDSKGRVSTGLMVRDIDLPNLSWNKITTDKPTTLEGYGITNGVSKSGDTMSGFLVLHNDPVSDDHLATKQYVDSFVEAASGGSVASPGEIILSTKSNTPNGYLRCNGSSLSKTAYADLYTAIGDSETYEQNEGIGLPFKHQYAFNNFSGNNFDMVNTGQQTLVDNNGTVEPLFLENSYLIVTKNRLYAFGGWMRDTNKLKVYTATINETTGVISTFVVDPNVTFPATMTNDQDLPLSDLTLQNHGCAFIIKNKLYLLADEFTDSTLPSYTDYTYRSCLVSTINETDGTLSAFTFLSIKLPFRIHSPRVAIIKNRVYIMQYAKYDTNSPVISYILYSDIDQNGNLLGWEIYQNKIIPFEAFLSTIVVTDRYIHSISGDCGYGGTATHTYDTDLYPDFSVYSIPIYPNGELGDWFISRKISRNFYCYTLDSSYVVTKNKVILSSCYMGNLAGPSNPDWLWGSVAGSDYNPGVVYFDIQPDGLLSDIKYYTNNFTLIDYPSLVVIKDKIVILGGYTDPNGNYDDNYDIYTITISGNYTDYSTFLSGTYQYADNTRFNIPNILDKDNIYHYIKY